MAPPSENRDNKDQRDAQQSSDNPFIKFRQFADAQVGSILQSLIGLPSAFSKSSDNQHWADFDDDLKRRDELQTRKQALKDSETGQSPGEDNQSEVCMPVKKSPDWTQAARSRYNHPPTTKNMDDEGEREWLEAEEEATSNNDIPLYAPVTKSLFAHLKQAAEDNVNWNQRELDGFKPIVLSLPAGWEKFQSPDGQQYFWNEETKESTRNPMATLLYVLRSNQKPANFSQALQYMAFNNLNSTANIPANLWGYSTLHSDSSLLPYLLFSSYSPLKLNHMFRTSPGPDYMAAFEDLILLHNGSPMVSGKGRTFTTLDSSKDGMRWVYYLRSSGILNEPDHLLRMVNAATSADGTSIMKDVFQSLFKASAQVIDSSKDPNTELDTYERFLQSASSPHGLSHAQLEYAEAIRSIRQELEASEFEKWKTHFETPPEKATEKSPLRNAHVDYVEAERLFRELEGSEFGTGKTKVVEKIPMPNTPKQNPDPERVVSSFTSSEHITHDDGTVETILSIRKRFADGRETVTETTHTRLPRSGEEPTDVEQGQEPEAKSESRKKGWFWN